MNLGFSEIISAIEAELSIQYIGGCVKWADENHDNAWSKAMARFDEALVACIERKDYTSAKIAGEQYKRTCLDLLWKFKTAKKLHDTESFLGSLRDTAKSIRAPS
jgi:hypothetical protein